MVIVIIGILSAIAAAKWIDLSNSTKIATCKTNQMSIESAQRMHYAKHYIDGNSEYAATIQDLIPYYMDSRIPACPDENGQLQLLPNGSATCTINSHKRQ